MKLNEQIDRVELLIEAISPFAGGIKTATRPTVFPLKGIGQKTQVNSKKLRTMKLSEKILKEKEF